VDGDAEGDAAEAAKLLRRWKLSSVPRGQIRTQIKDRIADARARGKLSALIGN
jgi:hypothetical protein